MLVLQMFLYAYCGKTVVDCLTLKTKKPLLQAAPKSYFMKNY